MLIELLRTRLRPYRRPMALAALLQAVEVVGVLLLPTLNAAVINHGVVTGDRGDVLRFGALMVLVALVVVAAGIGSVYFAARTALAFGRDLRSAVFRRVLDLSARQVGRIGSSSLEVRTVNDVAHLEALVLAVFTALAAAPLTCLGSLVLALNQSVSLSAVPAALLPVIAVVVVLVVVRMTAGYRRLQPRLDRLNRTLGEQITGIRVVRAFVRGEYERARFRRTNEEVLRHSLTVGRLLATMFPTVTLTANLATVAVVWLGAVRVDGGAVRIGTVTAFVEYLVLIVWSVAMTTFVFVTVPRASVSARRIREVLDTEPELAAPRDPVHPGTAPGSLELRGVGFRYQGAEEPALRDVDLAARPGETVAITGSTGSGKTTLLNLVLRLSEVSTGAVLVNGVDVRRLDGGALTATVGLVPQRAHLLTGTVAGNLRFGDPDATTAQLWRALEVAQAREFVERMPGGLDAPISHGGGNLSGGQRQRLTIARTLLRRPRIYLFDDCFSALDQATEAALLAELAVETAGATVLMVAQRTSTIRRADRVVVLDEGRVAGTGRHEDLLGNPVYREIAHAQPARMEAG
ncbi:ABC transporter ATP-binding protein [Amycolatopsis cihanbeyliensis]|uniref:ATP-binding cassette subfamily B protein n=1 Tax=Amycolatopsis cihanbeyliensis TaxID=1128664 RepID=A0A542DBE5_AMYCI|nr:ABC transporter ATP-binding protein [Amycolatopsis cihanbeyliensis]TQJ00392.1 ATP-binding cassette subfamily B protein [Amycolatopsis cihanbeyliensis]